MKEFYYTYNNEAIATCIFLEILREKSNMDITLSTLMLPFLLDNRTVFYLRKNASISLTEFIQKKPRLFVSFNNRYNSLLPISINAIMILYNAKQIYIKDNDLHRNNNIEFPSEIGERFMQIRETVPILLRLIEPHSVVDLFNILKIKL